MTEEKIREEKEMIRRTELEDINQIEEYKRKRERTFERFLVKSKNSRESILLKELKWA